MKTATLLVLFIPQIVAPRTETQWCKYLKVHEPIFKNAILEYTLHDKSRVDLLLPTYAVEADWAHGLKPFEGVGQSLYYAELTNRKPGLLLLWDGDDKNLKYVYKGIIAAKAAGIRVWVYDTKRRKLWNDERKIKY